MDKNLITLDELQLYVTSQGNTNNDKVKTFLNEVFQMGFSMKYDLYQIKNYFPQMEFSIKYRDIFPMHDFEYGD